MKKRFVVSVSDMSEEEEENFVNSLKEKGIVWRKLFDYLWVVVDESGDFTAASLTDHLVTIAPTTPKIIINIKDLDSVDIAGRIFYTPGDEISDWLDEYWNESGK